MHSIPFLPEQTCRSTMRALVLRYPVGDRSNSPPICWSGAGGWRVRRRARGCPVVGFRCQPCDTVAVGSQAGWSYQRNSGLVVSEPARGASARPYVVLLVEVFAFAVSASGEQLSACRPCGSAPVDPGGDARCCHPQVIVCGLGRAQAHIGITIPSSRSNRQHGGSALSVYCVLAHLRGQQRCGCSRRPAGLSTGNWTSSTAAQGPRGG